MVLAYHIIFGAYGFWLPNDLRGSWSDFVWSWELRRFGPATTTQARRSVAHAPHDHHLREAAKLALKYPAVVFNGAQAAVVGRGFARIVRNNGYRVHACSILPEHVHMVIGRHHYDAGQVVRAMKQGATEEMAKARCHQLVRHQDRQGRVPTPWARGCWHVFLDDEAEVQRAVRYVENNPIRQSLRPQRWHCVVPWQNVDLRSTAKPAIVRRQSAIGN